MTTEASSTATLDAKTHWLAAYGARVAALGLPATPDSAPSDIRSNSYDVVRDALDAEIEGLRTILDTALATRNRLSLTDNLPADILEYIFLDLAELVPMNLSSGRGFKALGWVVVTHVSRRWRSVATDYAALWSNLVFGPDQPWSIFLERSKQAPLAVRGKWQDPSADRYFGHVLAHLHRIQTLSLGAVDPASIIKLHSMLETPLPELRTLSIRANLYKEFPKGRLPSDFLSRITPKITHLCLQSMGFPTGTSTSLRSLKLVRWFRPDFPDQVLSYTFRGLLSALHPSHLPALEHLSLDNMIPSRDPENEEDLVPISMPRLKNLFIQEKGRLCFDLWEFLDTPPTAKISISSRHDGANLPPTLQSIVLSLTRCAHKYLDDHTLSDLSLRFGYRPWRGVKLGLAFPDPAIHEPVTEPFYFTHTTSTSLDLVIKSYDSASQANALFRSLATAIPMQLIKNVSLSSWLPFDALSSAAHPFDDVDIRSILSNADSVTGLGLSGSVATYAALRALTSTGPHDHFVPNLKHIHLHEVAPHRTVPGADAPIIDILNRALDERYRHRGLFLDSISFINCHVLEASSLAHLREAGRWGGQTRVIVDGTIGRMA